VQPAGRPEQDWNLMERTDVAEIDELESAEPEERSTRRGTNLRHARAEHLEAADVFAVLVIEIVRRVQRSARNRATLGPAIKAARSPADAVQRAFVGVVNDGANVIVDTKHF